MLSLIQKGSLAILLLCSFIVQGYGTPGAQGFAREPHASKSGWFRTWSRPEYVEWAKETPEGYDLTIMRKEKDGNYLVVKAKLIMREKGLPAFEVLEQLNVPDEKMALKQIRLWKGLSPSVRTRRAPPAA